MDPVADLSVQPGTSSFTGSAQLKVQSYDDRRDFVNAVDEIPMVHAIRSSLFGLVSGKSN